MKKVLASLAALVAFLFVLALPSPPPLSATVCSLSCTENCWNMNSGWDGSTYWVLDVCSYDGCDNDPGHMLRYMNSNGVIQYWPY
jgi:hypothetical protein